MNIVKKLMAFLLMLSICFVGLPTKTEAANPTDWWADRDAEVTPYIYSYLIDHAGFSAYTFANQPVKMYPTDTLEFKVLHKTDSFFVGHFRNEKTHVLVAKNGLVLAFSPKEMAHRMSLNKSANEPILHLKSLDRAVRTFIGPKIENASYINFASLNSNKLSVFRDTDFNIDIPANSTINHLAVHQNLPSGAFALIGDGRYTELPANLLTPGKKHSLHIQGFNFKIDEQTLTAAPINTATIFYTANDFMKINYGDKFEHYALTNHFKPMISDMTNKHGAHGDVVWAVKKGLLRGYEDGSFKPERELTESQFVSVFAKYLGINTSLDGETPGYNMEGAYTYLEQFGFPLKGYHDKKARSMPVTRGVIAQTLSMSQGGPSDVKGAYQFLYKNGLTVVNSFPKFNANSSLKRSHISSFFQRMDERGMHTIQR